MRNNPLRACGWSSNEFPTAHSIHAADRSATSAGRSTLGRCSNSGGTVCAGSQVTPLSRVTAISIPPVTYGFLDFDLLGTGGLDPGATALLDIPPNSNIAACKLL